MPFKRKELNIGGENLWYLTGLITSDGSLSKDRRHIDITSSDYEFPQDIKDIIGIKRKLDLARGCINSSCKWKKSKTI